jgi:hypothetical protein
MANYLLSQTEWKDLQLLTGDDFKYTTEDYAIGFRKITGDTSTKDWVDYALYLLQESGDIDLIASNYGLKNVLKAIPAKEEPAEPVAGSLVGGRCDGKYFPTALLHLHNRERDKLVPACGRRCPCP